MKSTREMIEVMEAYERGEQIECRSLMGDVWSLSFRALMGDVWSLLPTPLWDWQGCDYRVKPEPKLRPWKPEEVPLGAVVIGKETGVKSLIVAALEQGVTLGAGFCYYDKLLKYYVLEDGSPCGVSE